MRRISQSHKATEQKSFLFSMLTKRASASNPKSQIPNQKSKVVLGMVVAVGLFAAINRAGQTHYWRHPHTGESLIDLVHAPKYYARRSGDLTANVIGSTSWLSQTTEYRLNAGDWRAVGHDDQRARRPMFVIEMADAELNAGENRLELRATPYWGPVESQHTVFQYSRQPVRLPVTVDWRHTPLDASNGYWQRFREGNAWRVRVRPGYEGYDWVLNVTGAFAEGRRVKTDMVFRSSETKGYGFGTLPLWGGMPDEPQVSPRRGWNFAITWYWTKPGGWSTEFSYFHPRDKNRFVRDVRPAKIEPGQKYHLVSEAWPRHDAQGQHAGFQQRMRWWPAGSREPNDWLTLDDRECPLPEGEYAVALVALRCQVDFGPVTVSPLEVEQVVLNKPANSQVQAP